MNRKQELILCGISWHLELVWAGHCDIGIVACDKKKTLFVVSACCTDSVNKGLIYLVGHFIALGFWKRAWVFAHVCVIESVTKLFVCTLKYKSVGVFFISVRYLRPHGLIHFKRLVNVALLGRAEHSPPASVPVVVYDNIHIIIQSVVYYLLHSVEIGFIYGVIAFFILHCVCPCHRHTERVKTACFHALYHFFRCDRLTPESFKAFRVGVCGIAFMTVGLHCVAEVCAVAQKSCKLGCGKVFVYTSVIRGLCTLLCLWWAVASLSTACKQCSTAHDRRSKKRDSFDGSHIISSYFINTNSSSSKSGLFLK